MFLDFVSVFLQQVLEIVIPVLATALAGLVIAWLTQVINNIKAKLTANQQWIIEEIVSTAVMAAEQVGLTQLALDKKQYALGVAENWLAVKGIKLDLGILDAMIEAAVLDEFNRRRVPSSFVESEPE